jgi:hypothetical protein
LLEKWEPKPDFVKIRTAVAEIVALLNHHQIRLVKPGKQLWVLMNDKDDGKVKWAEMTQLTFAEK